MNINKLQSIVGVPSGRKELIKQFQNTNDIVNAVIEQHKLNKNAFKKIANSFNKSSDYETCRSIWEFTHYNLNYKAEPDLQTVKTLSKILYDGTNSKGNDCKHFSCFEAGILEALEIPYVYRFAAYEGKIPTHVYVVAKLKSGEVVLDAVLPYFDSEKTYTYKIDINPNKNKNMPLYRLSGVPTIGKTISKAAHNVKLVAFAPGRLAFLDLVKFNVFGLAVKFNTAIMKDRKAVEDFWYNQGGKDFGKLLANAIEGKTKKRIFGLDQNTIDMSPDYMSARVGFDPATITAGIASATAILAAIKGLFNTLGINHSDVATTASAEAPVIPETPPTDNKPGASINTTTILLIGAAVVAFMLIKKK
jgi:hypothetical protein